MYFRIDPSSGVPLGVQIKSGLRLAIAKGRLRIGERLPSARDLATQLQVNFHTVRKAYGELQTDGILEFRRGRGTYVKQRQRMRVAELRRLVRSHVARLMEDMAGLSIHDDELWGLIQTELQRLLPQGRWKR